MVNKKQKELKAKGKKSKSREKSPKGTKKVEPTEQPEILEKSEKAEKSEFSQNPHLEVKPKKVPKGKNSEKSLASNGNKKSKRKKKVTINKKISIRSVSEDGSELYDDVAPAPKEESSSSSSSPSLEPLNEDMELGTPIDPISKVEPSNQIVQRKNSFLLATSHFSSGHKHSECPECQEMAKSEEVQSKLKMSKINTNIVDYLKKHYHEELSGAISESVKNKKPSLYKDLVPARSSTSSSIYKKLSDAPAKMRDKVLQNGIHINGNFCILIVIESQADIITKFRKDISNPTTSKTIPDLDRILLNQLYKDDKIRNTLCEKKNIEVYKTPKEKIKSMNMSQDRINVILGKKVGDGIPKV